MTKKKDKDFSPFSLFMKGGIDVDRKNVTSNHLVQPSPFVEIVNVLTDSKHGFRSSLSLSLWL